MEHKHAFITCKCEGVAQETWQQPSGRIILQICALCLSALIHTNVVYSDRTLLAHIQSVCPRYFSKCATRRHFILWIWTFAWPGDSPTLCRGRKEWIVMRNVPE